MNITHLMPGQRAVVAHVWGNDAVALRLQELGMIPGTTIILQRIAPTGDPLLVHLRGYALALRKTHAARIELYREEAA